MLIIGCGAEKMLVLDEAAGYLREFAAKLPVSGKGVSSKSLFIFG